MVSITRILVALQYLGAAAPTVQATDINNVSAALLATSVIATLNGLRVEKNVVSK